MINVMVAMCDQTSMGNFESLVSRFHATECHPIDMYVYMVYCLEHYNDIIVGTMASQITSLTIVYSTVYSSADQIKH